MDPLSIATGTMAIASFALQLTGSVRKVQMLFRDMVGAPKELQRLLELLDNLDDLLDGIRELSQKQEDAATSLGSRILLRALTTCQNELARLGKEVEKYSPMLRT